jgi:hypothetical protein
MEAAGRGIAREETAMPLPRCLHSTPPPPEHRIPKPPDNNERHDQPVPVDLLPEPVLPEPTQDAPSHRVIGHRLPAGARRVLH